MSCFGYIVEIELGREPIHEEVLEYWDKKYTITEQERREAQEKLEERNKKWK